MTPKQLQAQLDRAAARVLRHRRRVDRQRRRVLHAAVDAGTSSGGCPGTYYVKVTARMREDD